MITRCRASARKKAAIARESQAEGAVVSEWPASMASARNSRSAACEYARCSRVQPRGRSLDQCKDQVIVLSATRSRRWSSAAFPAAPYLWIQRSTTLGLRPNCSAPRAVMLLFPASQSHVDRSPRVGCGPRSLAERFGDVRAFGVD